jgi:hypothetical protein
MPVFPATSNIAGAVRLRIKQLPNSEASKTLARARQAMEVAAARSEAEPALKALKELEKGCERAIAKIAERAGLTHRVYTVTPGPILQRRAFE